MNIKINSTNTDCIGITIVSPTPPAPLMLEIAHTMQNMIIQAEQDKHQELEMAKILYEFISSNAHLFSTPVLEAAKHLLEEITKAEMNLNAGQAE